LKNLEFTGKRPYYPSMDPNAMGGEYKMLNRKSKPDFKRNNSPPVKAIKKSIDNLTKLINMYEDVEEGDKDQK
jgi:hypothetical protein